MNHMNRMKNGGGMRVGRVATKGTKKRGEEWWRNLGGVAENGQMGGRGEREGGRGNGRGKTRMGEEGRFFPRGGEAGTGDAVETGVARRVIPPVLEQAGRTE